MQAMVTGVSRMKGVGKSSKQPYDIAKLFVLQPVKPVSRENMELSGFGFETAEISMRPDALTQFEGVKFPANLDLVTDMEARGGVLLPIVVGVKRS